MSTNPLHGNASADQAAELLKNARVTSGPERQLATAQQATAAALLAVAYEIRRANAASNGKHDLFPRGTFQENPGDTCGAEFLDAFQFVSECRLPAGHAGDHAEVQP